GMRVVVPFGKKKMYSAIIYLVHSIKPNLPYEIKEIICFLDEKPIIRPLQIKFWEWIANYYLSSLGEVYQSAIPSGLKLESETRICINSSFEIDDSFSKREMKILEALSDKKEITISQLIKKTGINNILPLLNSLLEKNAIEIKEELTEKIRPKTEIFVRLSPSAQNEEQLHQIFDSLARAKKQLNLLMTYVELSKCLSPQPVEVSKKMLLEKSGVSATTLDALVKRKILETYTKEIDRLNHSALPVNDLYPLNSFQQKALSEIEEQFLQKNVVLLHGVTSSGKTELYLHLIQKTLNEGKQVLYLVPEIALTTQLTSRLRRVFGNKLGVYHSRFSDAERVEIWNNVLNNKGYEIIIGARSSIFLPFRQLGLIIVDEEQETSYKQFDPAPRYHARNAAIVLTSLHEAKTLLGTATPAIESYYNAQIGKYGLVELNQRYLELSMPEILVVDLKEAYRKRQIEGHFTPLLLEKMKNALENREQIILFQNRRGYARYLECKMCAYVPKCKNCDVSLTFHKTSNTLICHYCGYSEPISTVCPACGTPHELSNKGFGTEKIEDEIRKFFPETRIARMDLDTTKSRKSYEKIIADFEQYKIDILVGTQMVTKGLDFDRVSLVGILNADNLFHFPDFRAYERAFQLLAQVSGRAGRKNKQGTVILQTFEPQHPIIQQVINNDYLSMY
ncbi:MAG TPA: primosomal protein N', partial [Paludibacteraceae bacterium]|nr:primosomal protein N' [Paludibacteraceae bacterium]